MQTISSGERKSDTSTPTRAADTSSLAVSERLPPQAERTRLLRALSPNANAM